MSTLLPIDPADFPDVPTRKAFIALDLQNDFLASDGALPVTQPDGMVARIVDLATAVRDSGYGEVIWVRSQFDTARPAGEPQLVAAAETPRRPAQPGASSIPPAPDSEAPPAVSDAAVAGDGDGEAFLSVFEGEGEDAEQQQPPPPPPPKCVRKGTKGAELLPAIAAAKGPRDYAMTKSYYSAFQSGQLLNLLRRQFATELIICGALSNVSVYATALAASAHGLDITVVEDCCGYRSERRHTDAARRLMDQTGCVFAKAADVIPTLKPRSPASTPASGHPPWSPAPPDIAPELIAAAVAVGKHSGGRPVRPPPSPSPPQTPSPEAGAAKGETKARTPTTGKEDNGGDGTSVAAAASSPSRPPSPSSTDLLVSMEKLKLSTCLPESATATTTTTATSAPAGDDNVAALLAREDDSPQAWAHVVAWDGRA